MTAKMQHTSIYLPATLHQALRIAAVTQKTSMSDLIIQALNGQWSLNSYDPNEMVLISRTELEQLRASS